MSREIFNIRMKIITEMGKGFKMMILIIKVIYSMEEIWITKAITKIIILPDIISVNKIRTTTYRRNQIKTMIGSGKENTVKRGATNINSWIKAIEVQGKTIG